ncbi:hypothetical protein OXIME_000422 [Oxyplasma meridianum]|uniref:Endonuclease V n=1 Tax=Oxyplasma meridianum TaxID=3073602 RepID=A0AAX4NEV5_9ARCH
MVRVGIFTLDFKFYHDIIADLRKWKIPFTSLESKSNIPRDILVVLSSEKDERFWDRQINARDSTYGIRNSLPLLMNLETFDEVIIGVDPGPYPGLAVVADNVLTEAFEMPLIEMVRSEVIKIRDSYRYRNISIKIGDGDKPHRDQIIHDLISTGIDIKVVDERNTSMPHKIHNNALSAARIASLGNIFVPPRNNEKMGKKDVYDREFLTIQAALNNVF